MDVNLQEKFLHHIEVAKGFFYDVESEALHNSIRALLTTIQISRKQGFHLADPPSDFLIMTEGLIRNTKLPMDLAIVAGKVNCLTKVFIQKNPTTIENLLMQSSLISERVPKICFMFGIMDCLPCDRCDVTLVTVAEEILQLLLNFNSVYFYQMKLFHTWLQYVQNIVCFIPNSNPIRTQLLVPQSVMMELTLLHLETTQVQNVSEQCLATICDIWRSLQLSSQYANTIAKNTLINLTWQSKSKYLILATLLPFINLSEILSEYPDTINAMTYSLNSNVKCLLAAGTTLFKALAKSLTFDAWVTYCQSVLLDALNHSNPIIQRNAAHNWLPCLVYASPLVLVELKQRLLKANSLNWLAYISLLRLIDHPDEGDRLLAHRALNHGDEEVRVVAFATLLHTNKKTEAVGSRDWDLVSNFLLNNLRSDNPHFRLRLLSTTRLFLIRVLESSLNRIKNNRAVNEDIDNLRKLHDCLLKRLTKSSSYHKKITSLGALHYILQLFGESDAQADSLAKGASLTKRRQLVQLAGDRWDFTGKMPLDHYTICLMDEVPDIREKAAEILRNFFPCPPLSYVQLLYSQGLEMCDSAQFLRSEGGAVIIKIVSHWSFSNIAVIPELTVNFLVEEIKRRLNQLKSDWLTGALRQPVHGFVGALNQVLQLPHHQHSVKSYTDLIELSEMISCYMLDMLSNKSSGNQVMAPSYEEMSQSVEEIVRRCNTTKMNGKISISVQHQLILACAWLNLKESGNLAAQVATLLLNDQLIAKEKRTYKIEQCAEIIYRILLRCRHKGAIEAAGDAMGLICRKMFANQDEVIRTIPGRILTNFLGRLGNLELGASVTRRSAGLAYLVSKIISSQPEKSSSESLLVVATKRLINVAQRPVDLTEDQDETCDLPQSVAIHILKSLVLDASLSVGLQPELMGPIFQLSINSFSHPHWSVRNAVLQLHGAVIQRLIGTSSRTTTDLFHKLPGLETFLIDKLGEVTDDQKLISRCLIPSLSILSRLSPGHRHEYRNFRFTFSLMAVLGHPVHQVRQLAARSLLAFVPLFKTKCITLQLCADAVILANGKDSDKPLYMCVRGSSSTNSLHGCLLAIFECVRRCLDITLSVEDFKLIRKAVSEFTTIENDHPSYYIKLAILKIFQILPGIMTEDSEFLRVYRDESVRQMHAHQPGFNEWLKLKTELLFSEVSINSIWEIHAMAIQDYLAFYSGMDVLEIILKVITNRFARFSSSSVMANHVNSYMMYYIAHWQTFPSLLPVCLDFVQARGAMALQETETSLQEHINFFLDHCIEKRQLGSALALLAIPTASVVIKETLAKNLIIEGIDEVVLRLTRCLLDASQPEESSSFRYAAAASLKTIGRTLMEKANKSFETSRNLFLLILNLIQDEDKNIRDNAALFLTDLVSSVKSSSKEQSSLLLMSPPWCLEGFSRHIHRWFSKQNLIPIIFNMLKDPDQVAEDDIEFLYNREPRNFFHDEADLVHFLIKVVDSLSATFQSDSKPFQLDFDMQETETEATQCLDRISNLWFRAEANEWLFTQSSASYSVLIRLCARLTIKILCYPNWKTDQRFLELKKKIEWLTH